MKTRTCAWTATLLVAALAPASPARGVSPLVYVDSNDQIIGESAGGASPETVIVRFGSQFAILFPSVDGLGSASCFYYMDAACETSPLVPAKSYWEGRVLPQGYYYDGQVYSVDPSTPGTFCQPGVDGALNRKAPSPTVSAPPGARSFALSPRRSAP